jgi:peptide/nickel transport system substrate-binding protein
VLAGSACRSSRGALTDPRETGITVQYPGEERILGPYWDMPAKLMMFLPLVRTDEQGDLEPVLARSWEHSADYRSWTIHLRSDVKWHDGVRFTAHDIKFTFDLWSHPKVLWGSPGAATLTVQNDTTYRVEYHRGADSPLDTWSVYYPRHLLEGLDPAAFSSWEFWTRPVGNGPYRYVRHVPKTMMELEANPDYFGGTPRIRHLVLKFGSSSPTELLSGNVDALGWASERDVVALAKDSRFASYYQVNSGARRAVLWKASHPLFGDARVRRALTHAINRRELHTAMDLPADLPIFDVLATVSHFRRREIPDPIPFDPPRARALLAEAGWRDADGDGILERGGRPFRFTLLAPGEEQRSAVYLQEQFRRVGVRAEVQVADLNVVRRRSWAGDFEAIVAILDQQHESTFFGAQSVTGYRNPRVAALLDRARLVVDPKEQDAIYRELMPIFQAELPATILYPLVSSFVVHRRIRGLQSPFRADPLVELERLWIEEPSRE